MTAPKFAASSQAKHEGWFSRRHKTRDAHSEARNARYDKETRKAALAERPIKERTKPQLTKVDAGVFTHENGCTYHVDKEIHKYENVGFAPIVIPEGTRMARKLRRANAA